LGGSSNKTTFRGSHPVVRTALTLAGKLARARVPAVIVGEPGTGKKTLARWIHWQLGERAADLVALDASCEDAEARLRHLHCRLRERSLPSTLVTTLLVADVASASPDAQAVLVEILRAGRAGSGQGPPVRVIAMSQREPSRDRRSGGGLTAELQAMLGPVMLYLPPLRDRRCDIPELARHFLALRARPDNGAPHRLTDEAMVHLWEHDWPGNVRELRDVVSEAAASSRTSAIRSADLPSRLRATPLEKAKRTPWAKRSLAQQVAS
jgi:DNA-binding NtrC family response regulator